MKKHLFLLLSILPVLLTGCLDSPAPTPFKQEAVRSPQPGDFPGDGWIGYAVAYSGFREGQDPEGEMPTKAQIREDLHILAPHWSYIRLYASNRPDTRLVLEVIEEDKLDLKVVLGAWLQCETAGHYAYKDSYAAINEKEVQTAIALSREFGETVVAVTVGNEILVDWSFWPVPLERVIQLVQRVQKETGLPVSVADDYSAWASPGGVKLADVVDFVFVHTHPIWHAKGIEDGFSDFLDTFEQVRNAVGHDKRIIIGETGWATLTDPPEKEPLHAPGAGNEPNQERFFIELHDWAIREGVPVFWFEAFDEPWKGEGTEGYWGLYSVDRKPRKVMQSK
jgi:exo-beta-1,3-glucanase (GH17 family)